MTPDVETEVCRANSLRALLMVCVCVLFVADSWDTHVAEGDALEDDLVDKATVQRALAQGSFQDLLTEAADYTDEWFR